MKKLLFIILISVFAVNGDAQITSYDLNATGKSCRFDGTQANFTQGMIYLNVDTAANICFPGLYYIQFYNQQYITPCWIVYNSGQYNQYSVYDSLGFYTNFSYNSDDRCLVWKSQKTNYSTTAAADARYKPTITANVLTVGTGTAQLPSINSPTYNISITSGTAFQPNSAVDSYILVSSALTGGIGVYGSSVISMCSTQSGTYTNIGSGNSFLIGIVAVADNKVSATIPVPKGYWVKVIDTAVGLGGGITSTYTRW